MTTAPFAKSWTESLVTVAHEGGHMATPALTGRGHRGFTLEEGKDYEGNAATDGATRPIDSTFGATVRARRRPRRSHWCGCS